MTVDLSGLFAAAAALAGVLAGILILAASIELLYDRSPGARNLAMNPRDLAPTSDSAPDPDDTTFRIAVDVTNKDRAGAWRFGFCLERERTFSGGQPRFWEAMLYFSDIPSLRTRLIGLLQSRGRLSLSTHFKEARVDVPSVQIRSYAELTLVLGALQASLNTMSRGATYDR